MGGLQAGPKIAANLSMVGHVHPISQCIGVETDPNVVDRTRPAQVNSDVSEDGHGVPLCLGNRACIEFEP
jgi:hypothetical protein